MFFGCFRSLCPFVGSALLLLGRSPYPFHLFAAGSISFEGVDQRLDCLYRLDRLRIHEATLFGHLLFNLPHDVKLSLGG